MQKQGGHRGYTQTPRAQPTAPRCAFLDAMRATGIAPADPARIVPDGQLHRFRVDGDKPGSLNGWAVLHLDGCPAGAFGNWRTGAVHAWRASGHERLTPAERLEHMQHMQRIAAAREAARIERERQHKTAAARAFDLWHYAPPADPAHLYAHRKRITPGTARQVGDALALPIVDFGGGLRSLQFIGPDGRKRLLSGGAKAGHFIPVSDGASARRVYVCEGWATGRTLAMSDPSAIVLAAIDAGNLMAVALGARDRWRSADLVMACDFDDVGMTKGRAAALASGARILPPPGNVPEGATDWNDLAVIAHARRGRGVAA
ncbi:MAG: toprim domain-containing protein [Pseudomonadota bacterium]